MTLKDIQKTLSAACFTFRPKRGNPGFYEVTGFSPTGVPGSYFWLLRADRARLEALVQAVLVERDTREGYTTTHDQQRKAVRMSKEAMTI